eukprot:15150227-Ditylum_brightwellii.AAC.1
MPKLAERGITCMFVGYAMTRHEMVYCMWTPQSNRVVISCDITWFKRMYFQKKVKDPEIVTEINAEARENVDPETSSNEFPVITDEDAGDDDVSKKDDNMAHAEQLLDMTTDDDPNEMTETT